MASGKDVRQGGAFVEFYTKGTNAVQKALDNMKAGMQKFAGTVMLIGASIAGVGAAVTAPFLAGLEVASEWGKEVVAGSRRTGIAFEELQSLAYALNTDLDGLGGATRKMNSFLEQAATGSHHANNMLAELGLTFQEIANLSPDEQIRKIAGALSEIRNTGQRGALQTAIFGRQGMNLNIAGGASGIREREAHGRDIGAVMSKEDVATVAAYNLATKELGIETRATWASIGVAIAPFMTKFVQMVTSVVHEVRGWINDNRELVAGIFRVFDYIILAGTAIGVFGSLIYGLSYAFTVLKVITGGAVIVNWLYTAALFAAKIATIGFAVVTALGSLVVAIFTGGVWALIVALAALVIGLGAAFVIGAGLAVIMNNWDGIASGLGAAWESFAATVVQAFGAISDAISAGDWALASQIAWVAIQLIWAKGVNWIRDLWFVWSGTFMDVWDTMVTAAAHAMFNMASGIEEAYHGIVNTIAGMLAMILGLFAQSINELIDLIPEQLRSTLGIEKVEFDGDAARADIAREADRERQQRAQRNQAIHQNIDDADAPARQRRALDVVDERARAAGEEADLQQELDDLEKIAAAKRKKKEKEVSKQTEGMRTDQGAGILQGTFNAAAVRGFIGSGPMDLMAERQQQLIDLTRELLQQVLRLQPFAMG